MILARALIVLLAVLAASVPAGAGECTTTDEKVDAILVFAEEHYGPNASMIYSFEEDPDLFEVQIFPYDPEVECTGRVRVSDECVVAEATEQAIVCST